MVRRVTETPRCRCRECQPGRKCFPCPKAWCEIMYRQTGHPNCRCPVLDTRVVCAWAQRQGQERGDGHEEPRRVAGTEPARDNAATGGTRVVGLEMQEDPPARAGRMQAAGAKGPLCVGLRCAEACGHSGGGAFGRGVTPCRSSGCLPDSACVLETSIPPSLSPPARPIPAPVPARPGHERSDPASTCCPWTSVLLAITGFIASNIRGLFGLTGRPPDAEYADDMRRRTFVRTG